MSTIAAEMNNNRNSPLRTYRLALVAVLTSAVVVLVYWPTFARMIDMWSLITYQHGWLVFPVSLFVLWRKRDALAALRWQASWIGVAVTALLVLIWTIAGSVGVQVAEFASATLIISAAYWAVAGTAAMRKAAFPLLLLLTAVPTGEFLVEPLMLVTARIASALLAFSGVPVLQDGQFFTLPGGLFEVADVCSGLRYLLAGVMASLAYAYVTYSNNIKRAAFVGITAVVLVVTNGVRAFIVMYIASATEMRIFGGIDHVWFGMFLFATVFIVMIWFGERYADPIAEPPFRRAHEAVTGRGVDAGGASLPVTAVALALVVGGALFQYTKTYHIAPAVTGQSLPPLTGCSGPLDWSADLSPGFPHYRGADLILRQTYACGNADTSVYIADYQRQEQGKELVSSTNRVWPHDWRRFTNQSTATIASESGAVEVREVQIRDPERPRLVWYWYQVGDAVTGSEIRVKMLEARHALRFRPVTSSVVVVAVVGERDGDPLALREELQPRAETVMAWNRSRAGEAH